MRKSSCYILTDQKNVKWTSIHWRHRIQTFDFDGSRRNMAEAFPRSACVSKKEGLEGWLWRGAMWKGWAFEFWVFPRCRRDDKSISDCCVEICSKWKRWVLVAKSLSDIAIKSDKSISSTSCAAGCGISILSMLQSSSPWSWGLLGWCHISLDTSVIAGTATVHIFVYTSILIPDAFWSKHGREDEPGSCCESILYIDSDWWAHVEMEGSNK